MYVVGLVSVAFVDGCCWLVVWCFVKFVVVYCVCLLWSFIVLCLIL